jgi:hypothetical protein
MTEGPGKYDHLATIVRELSSAEGIIVIVFEGDRGSGFSVQATPKVTETMPSILRQIADDIEKDMA